jgi:hypothetical protein
MMGFMRTTRQQAIIGTFSSAIVHSEDWVKSPVVTVRSRENQVKENEERNVQEVSPPGFAPRIAILRVGRRTMDTSMELRICEFS